VIDFNSIELTPEEIKEALYEGKKKKYFREKHAPYWQEQEKPKSKKKNEDHINSKSKGQS
jgi:cytochrome b subunit of formate dehydrogenase